MLAFHSMMCSPLPKATKYATALTLLCLLQACTTGMLARNLDWLIERYIGGYFELSDAQAELLPALVEDSAQRSASNSLPAILDLLDQVIELNEQHKLVEHIDSLADEIQALETRFAADNRHNLIEFALTINADQREQIARELDERNRKYEEKHVTPGDDARRKDFAKDASRNTRRWLGRLNDTQEAALDDYVSQYRLNEAQWLSSRKSWQLAFLNALAMTDSQAKSDRLAALIDEPETTFSAQQCPKQFGRFIFNQ